MLFNIVQKENRKKRNENESISELKNVKTA